MITLQEALAVLTKRGYQPYRSGNGWKSERTWPTDEALILEASAFAQADEETDKEKEN